MYKGNLKLEIGHEVRLARSDGSEAANLKENNSPKFQISSFTFQIS